ncbi:756_t:CDS:1, partial [Dentiscutata heterogama]
VKRWYVLGMGRMQTSNQPTSEKRCLSTAHGIMKSIEQGPKLVVFAKKTLKCMA